jgi:hypothetical protein
MIPHGDVRKIFMYVLKIPAKPDGGGRAKSKFRENLVFGVEYLAQADRIKSFCLIATDDLILDLVLQR